MEGKTLSVPFSLEAEMAVIGACFMYPNLLNRAIMELSEEDFYDERNRNIFSVLKTLYDANPAVDFTIFLNYIEQRGLVEKCGGREHLAQIIDTVNVATGSVLFERYISIIKDKSIKRSIINAFQESVKMAYEDNEEADKILDKVESVIFDIRTRGLRISDWRSVADVIREVHNVIDARMEGRISSGSLHTGFTDLDNIIGGFQPGEWVILAARPSVGKTAFVLNIHRNLAYEGIPTAMFSLEMSAELICMRLLSMESKIPMTKFKEGYIDRSELPRFTKAVENIMEMPIYIDDTGNMDIFELRSKARIAVKEFGVRMISIDYLQLLSLGASVGKKMSRAEELAKISRSIKSLAKELGITIIGLSQVAREVEKRAEKKPLLSDLRESGALEQDADIVIFLYRPNQDKDTNLITVEVAKNRNGAQGKAELNFIKEYMRFENLAETGEYAVEEDDDIPI